MRKVNCIQFRVVKVSANEPFFVELRYDSINNIMLITRLDRDDNIVSQIHAEGKITIKICDDQSKAKENECLFSFVYNGWGNSELYSMHKDSLIELECFINNSYSNIPLAQNTLTSLDECETLKHKPIYIDYSGNMNGDDFVCFILHQLNSRAPMNVSNECGYRFSKCNNFKEVLAITSEYVKFSESSYNAIIKATKEHPEDFEFDGEVIEWDYEIDCEDDEEE